ncbi:competence protein ComFA [Pullulanibacillus pueri]|nr:competence protein ComFA [Pullulanibacillus pueri]
MRTLSKWWGNRLKPFPQTLQSLIKKTARISPLHHATHATPSHNKVNNTAKRPHLKPNPNFSYDQELQAELFGRRLLREELKAFSDDLIHQHLRNGFLKVEPGIRTEKGRPVCQRCGNHAPEQLASYQCGRCGQTCVYCRNCLTLGVVKACSQLFTWSGPPVAHPALPKLDLHWKGKLTSLQQQAADQLTQAVQVKEDFVIWAVTGAGKTEVLYPALKDAIETGQRIALVSPRTDVVIELSKRIKTVFSDIRVNVLYGESTEAYTPAPLTLATTHQLLRFYHSFDAIFIDEVDAFPFHNSKMLHYALEHALKPGAPRLFLTATPSSKMKADFERGRLKGVRIPERFHGHPLPLPTFEWMGNWRRQLEKNKLPVKIKRWTLTQLNTQRQAFLFVPSITTLETVLPMLKALDKRIVGVHAEDPLRHQKVEAFRSGEIQILVTTTILERGVTISSLDVAVFGADAELFDERALVQISGRVGRDHRDPTGGLYYFHYGVTWHMIKAFKHINQMNTLAKEWRMK